MRGLRFRGVAISVVLLAVVLPVTAFGQGRGHRNERGFGLGKKCGKFVNCHDARDGRWDGRGPRRTARVVRNRILVPRARVRERSRHFNDQDRFRYSGVSYKRRLVLRHRRH
jgi:hypothetical protein